MKRKMVIFLLVFWTAAGGTAGADPAVKLGRGLSNSAWGWFEIVNEMGHESDRRGPWIGIPAGLVRGSFLGIGRTLVGVFEIVTFFLPNGEKGYEAILLPESVFALR